MKFLIVLCLAVVFHTTSASLSAETIAKIAEKTKEFAKTCEEKTKASADDMHILMEEKAPSTREAKCLISCMANEAGLHFENGVVSDKTGFLDLIKAEDPDYYTKRTKITVDCFSEVPKSDDECEYHGKLYECNLKKSKEAKVAFSTFSI